MSCVSYALRIEPAIKDAIASWGIPVPVLREFYLRAADSLEAPTVNLRLREPSPDDRANHYKYSIAVDDHVPGGRYYEFFLGIDIHEREIWIVQCECWLVDQDGNIVWSSESP